MSRTRRLLRLLSGLTLALVAVIVLALIASQTPWFRDWLRRTAMRQAERVIDGQLIIGRIEGTLLTGITLADVEIVQGGAPVVSIDRVVVSYGLGELLSDARVIGHLTVERPVIHAVRTPTGWNLARLLKPRQSARPGAPRPTFALPDIQLVDGQVIVEGAGGAEPDRAIPRRIEGLHFSGGVTSGGDTLAIDVQSLRLRAASPALVLDALSGRIVSQRDGWHLEDVELRTGASALQVEGALTRAEPGAPLTFALDVAGERVSLPEVGRFLPVVASLDVQPRLRARVAGTLDALEVDLDMSSSAGDVDGDIRLDLTGPVRGIAGRDVAVSTVNLAPWLNSPNASGQITGTATFDLRLPSETPGVAMDGTFHFAGPRAGAYGYAATNVVADGRLRGRRITLQARGSAYGGQVTTQGTIDRPARAGGEVVLSLAGRIADVDLRDLPATVPVPALESDVTGAYTVTGPISRLRLTGTLDGSTVEGAQLADGFTGAFERTPGGYTFAADGDVAALDLPRLGRALDLPALEHERYAGLINGTFHVEGVRASDAAIIVDASGQVRDTDVYGGHVSTMDVSAHLEDDVLRAEGQGTVDGYDLAALSGIEALTGTLAGVVDARVVFNDLDAVSIDTVDVEGRATLQQPTVMNVPFSTIETDATLEDGVLQVRSLRGTGQGFTVTGQGRLALGATGSSDFAYRLDADSVTNPAKVADLPLTGAIVTDGRITGPREAFRVAGTAHGTSIGYDETLRSTSVDATYDVELPDLDPARLRVTTTVAAEQPTVADLAFAHAEGTVGYVPGTVTFDLAARDALRTIRGEGDVALGDGEQVVSLRTLSFEREGVQWTLADPGASSDRTTAPPATITVRPETVEVTPMMLVNGAQQVRLDGRIAIADGATHGLAISATAVDVGDALVLAAQDVDADGTLSLTARVEGSRQLPIVTGQFDVIEARFRGVPIAELRATVTDDGGAARVDAVLRQSDRASLTAQGRVPRTLFLPPDTTEVPASLDDTLDLTVRSNAIDLTLAEGLTPELSDLQGTATLDLHLTNTGRTPVVAGDVSVTGAGFVVARTGVRYRQLNADVTFEDDRAIIRTLSAESANGQPLTASGEIGLRRERKGQVTLRVEGDGVRVLDNELGYLDIDSKLQITGTIYAPVVEGDLLLADGRLELDELLPRFALGTYATESTYKGIPTYAAPDAPPVVPDILDPAVRDLEVIEAVPPRVAQAAAEARRADAAGADAGAGAAASDDAAVDAAAERFVYEDMAINVRVKLPDNLVLRGRGVEVARSGIGDVNVTMGGDFRIAKTAGDPLVLIGAVNTVRGTYAYQGRRFDIARDGQVLFRGDGTTNPSIDITAERVIQGVQARVRIQGTAEEPRLSLSSDPPLDEADVLALIVFNQPVNQLGTGQQNSLAERAGGIAAGLAISPIAQALGNTLDVDLFDVETTDQSGRVNPAIVIGQQVDQHLFVKFRQQFGNQQVSQFLLEYRLADFLRLQANAAEGDGLSRGNRSLTQRIERYGTDLVFYFAF